MPEPFDPQLWLRWKELFEQAADLDDAQQAELLNRHCLGDPELRARFSAMLAAHRQPAAILDRSLPDRFIALSAEAPEEPPPPPPPLPAGALLSHRYRIQEVIGRGGWSVVYLACDEQIQGRFVVIKVLLRQQAEECALDDEIAALSHLHHPGIAAPLDSGATPDGQRFLVLAYVPGRTLRAALIEDAALETGQVLRFLRAMSSALETAHAGGVCHLDLKPENIMLQRHRDKEEPVIVDFGISRLLRSSGSASESVAGSLAYMAPEQLNGTPGAASDQYSLALIASEMLTGSKPPPLGSVPAILAACEGLPPRARSALSRALSASPAQRYPGIGDFVASLTAALDPERRRFRRLGIAAVCTIAILLAAGALEFWFGRRHEQELIANDVLLINNQLHAWAQMADRSHFQPEAVESAVGGPIARLQRLVAEGHREPALLIALSDSLSLYGTYLGHPGHRNLGQSEKAVAAMRQSLEVAEMLDGLAPDILWWRVFTAERHDMLASTLIETGDYEQASRIARKGLALLEGFPKDGVHYRGSVSVRGGLQMTLSRVHCHRREFEECLRLRDEGVASRRAGLPLHKNSRSARYDLAGVLAARGYVLRDMGRLDEAHRDYSESRSTLKPLLEEETSNLQFRWLHARNAAEIGRLFLLRKQPRLARAHLEQSAELMRGLLDDSRHEISSLRTYALCLSYLAYARVRDGEAPGLARPLIDEAVQVNRIALERDPASAKIRDERDIIFQNARDAGIQPVVNSEIPLH
jgi:tetratricopeptide (TPR) repeat protein